MITISDGVATVELDDEMRWSDEHQWFAVGQSLSRSVTGAAIIQIRARSAGRPITLSSGDGMLYGCTWAGLLQLVAWANVPAQALAISIPARGLSLTNVLFRHDDGQSPIEADALIDYNDRSPDDLVAVRRLAFITQD